MNTPARRQRRNNHTSSNNTTPRAKRDELAVVEQLEPRLLLAGDAPCITNIDADNRGLVVVEVSEALRANTVNAQSVQIITAGQDGLLDTDDDVAANATVAYDPNNLTITIDAQNEIDANDPYAISINGDLIRAADNGQLLDAEFNGAGQDTGNGTPGGQLLVFASTANDDALFARITTNIGVIDIRMFPAETPLHVANFFAYADAGLYDGTIFHRSVNDFVVQGGGFSDNPPGYNPIQQFPPVQNEPGISNVRGTVALAKLGGNPSSGTNQFFFNISDNSSNLDNQNGGFTVFAEIADPASLAIADQLNQLATINASDTQGAFTDLPVLNPDATPDNFAPEDLALIQRVAALYQLSDTPLNQLGANPNTVAELDNPNGEGTVRIIDLSGNNPGNVETFINIIWGRSGDIARLTISEGAGNDYAIQIEDADTAVILDRRAPGDSDGLKFIASNGAINQIILTAPIDGFALSQTALPGGLSFDADIDGDGRTNDNTAIYVAQGLTTQLVSRADITGDLVFEGGARVINIAASTNNTDIRLGDQGVANPERTLSTIIVTGDARDTGVISDLPINAIVAGSWTDNDINRHTISAPSINAIVSRGAFSPPTLTVTEGNLGVIVARGTTNAGSWSIAGNASVIQLQDAVNLSIDVQGDLNTLVTNRVRVSDINVGGDLIALVTRGNIESSTINVDGTARVLTTIGDIIDSNISLNTNGSANDADAVAAVRIIGDTSNGSLAWNGNARALIVTGTIDNFDIGSDNAGTSVIRVRQVNDSFINTPNRLDVIVAGEFNDSELSTFANVRTAYFTSSFDGSLTILQAQNLYIAGDATFDSLTAGTITRFTVLGDIADSDLDFFANTNATGIQSVQFFTVRGDITNSSLLFQLPLGTMTAYSMTDSSITVGSQNDVTSLDNANPNAFNPVSNIQSLRIQPIDLINNIFGFRNSTITAGRIDNASIFNPDTTNDGQTFGIAANTIVSLSVPQRGGAVISVDSGQTDPFTQNDFQIRPSFTAPIPT